MAVPYSVLNINWINASRFRGEIVFVQLGGVRRVASLAEIVISFLAALAAHLAVGAELTDRAG